MEKKTQFEMFDMKIDVVRKDIKHMHLGVYPPDGKVRVAVPLRIDDEYVKMALISRIGWIRKQQKRFEEQHRQSMREMANGECHYFEGKAYRLRVIEKEGRSAVKFGANNFIEVYVKPGTGPEKAAEILMRFYRNEMKKRVPEMIDYWEKITGLSVSDWHVRRMKTRWGTCNTLTGRITLNLELMKKPRECMSYVVLHEMLHLLERKHNRNFKALMTRFLPAWPEIKKRLNAAPLSHEAWGE